MNETDLWHEAASLAARAHRNQLRRDRRTPYINHPARVALIVASKFGITDETILAAALLHDVIEDTTVDYDVLEQRFGKEVAEIVAHVSKDPRYPEDDRERRYDQWISEGPWQSRLVKLADVYDNLRDADDDSRQKFFGKARRALKLAENDPECRHAAAQLEALVSSMEARQPA
jgi:guanosine-3',5'-bis(diphosphate) 3'-pyrophosphohydrolase